MEMDPRQRLPPSYSCWGGRRVEGCTNRWGWRERDACSLSPPPRPCLPVLSSLNNPGRLSAAPASFVEINEVSRIPIPHSPFQRREEAADLLLGITGELPDGRLWKAQSQKCRQKKSHSRPLLPLPAGKGRDGICCVPALGHKVQNSVRAKQTSANLSPHLTPHLCGSAAALSLCSRSLSAILAVMPQGQRLLVLFPYHRSERE